MGSAACYHLAKRGVSVLGLDQFDVPHSRGSHHGHSRMIRQAYYEHPDYVPLLRRAYQLWDSVQEEWGNDRFFYRTGGLYIGSEDGSIVPGSLRSAKEHDLEHEIMSPSQIQDRFPRFKPAENHIGFFENEAGFLVPEKAVTAHARLAERHGAIINTNEPINDWESDGNRIEITTSQGTYSADHLVISSGAWSAELLKNVNLDLEVTRQILAWFEPKVDLEQLAPENFPCWFVETDTPFGHYGFPMLPGDPGLKIAIHKPGSAINPEEKDLDDNQPTDEEIRSLREVLDTYFPESVGALRESRVCLYTNSPDSHFVIDSHPTDSNVTVACGFSGHGFKFASVVGEALADLATKGKSELPIEFLGMGRFDS